MTAPGRHGGSGTTMSIGAVLDRLRADFPDVTISKIRFLESEGLVTPERTASGYRKFSPDHVERLRFVLTAQRDHYLPLKVIREQLEAADRGEGAAGRVGTTPVLTLAPTPDEASGPARPVPQTRMTRDGFCESAGITHAELKDMEKAGLVRVGAAGFFGGDAVRIARAAKALTDYGLDARHLRSLRTAADREAGLVLQVVTPVAKGRGAGSRARAEEMARGVSALMNELHEALVKAAIVEELDGQGR